MCLDSGLFPGAAVNFSSAKISLVQFQAAAAVEKHNIAVAHLLNFRSGSLKGDLVNNLLIHIPCFFIFPPLIPLMRSFVYESLIFVIEWLKEFASSFAPYTGMFNILEKKTARQLFLLLLSISHGLDKAE